MNCRGPLCGLIKEVGMGAGAKQEEHELLAIHTIDQEPIRADVTFPKTDIIAGEIVITILFGQGLLCSKLVHDGVQQIEITAAFSCEFEVFFEAVGENDLKHR